MCAFCKKNYNPTTVGVEPTTFWSEVKRANPLRYAVLNDIWFLLDNILYFLDSLTHFEKRKVAFFCFVVSFRLQDFLLESNSLRVKHFKNKFKFLYSIIKFHLKIQIWKTINFLGFFSINVVYTQSFLNIKYVFF